MHRDFVQGEDIRLKACHGFLLLKVTYLFFYIEIKYIPSKLSSCKRNKGRWEWNDAKNRIVEVAPTVIHSTTFGVIFFVDLQYVQYDSKCYNRIKINLYNILNLVYVKHY